MHTATNNYFGLPWQYSKREKLGLCWSWGQSLWLATDLYSITSVFPSPFKGHECKVAFICLFWEGPHPRYHVPWGISLDGD